jgi:hypothetical protein
MAYTLVQFQTPIASPDGMFYYARVCGDEHEGLWQAWIEFTPVGGGIPVRSGRETTQPNRTDTEYWARGLSTIYLEGALRRALAGPVPVVRARIQKPAFQQPAPPVAHAFVSNRESALDPFSVYAKGEALLRKQLAALSPWHLVNIVMAYELTNEPVDSLNRQPAAYLIELIVSSVREHEEADREMIERERVQIKSPTR